MSDKELIKQEIEKRLSFLWNLIPEGEKVLKDDFTKEDANNLSKYTELESLLQFIDSLPEEPIVKGITWEDVNTLDVLINQVRYEFPNGISEKSFGLAVLEKFQDYQDDIEEPASKDLEEAANFYANTHIEWFDSEGNPHVMPAFKAGAEWQEKKMLGIAEAFYQQGRYEQEQEMIKDAVEAEAMYPASSSTLQIRYKLPKNTKLKYGDKVKILILKEEK